MTRVQGYHVGRFIINLVVHSILTVYRVTRRIFGLRVSIDSFSFPSLLLLSIVSGGGANR